jgi:hypothetical protein
MGSTSQEGTLRGFLGTVVGAWNKFWFTPSDPTTLGLVRIFCGFLVFYVHLAYCYDLQTFFGRDAWVNLELMNELRHEAPQVGPQVGWQETKLERPLTDQEKEFKNRWGILPQQAVWIGQERFSLWFHVTDPFWMAVCHAIILGIMFLFAIGFCTRMTSVLTWLAALSYTHRAPTSLFGMDAMMNITLFYLMLGPSGAALSVDRLIARFVATRRALRLGLHLPIWTAPEPRMGATVAIRLLQINLAFIYFVSGMTKLQGQAWWNGVAVWGTMANYEFSPMTHTAYLSLLQFLSTHRWVWEIFVTSATFGTLATEISFIYLVWHRKLRWIMLMALVGMHLGIAFFMGLVGFSCIMLTMATAFIPPEAVRAALERFGRGPSGPRLAVQV